MGRLAFNNPRSLVTNVGVALFLFALLLQPLIGPITGEKKMVRGSGAVRSGA